MIPQYLHALFWDTDLENFDPLAFPTYTIGRILEYGDQDAIAWLKETFSDTQIVDVVQTERRLSRRSANFWALVYGVSPDRVAALRLGSANLLIWTRSSATRARKYWQSRSRVASRIP
jgi:hypothetical protein